ncbi:MAG: T9SS type B sorting domain-containing protein, partial [Winogradskyella sp.]|nr:T9SS type B sorting domain-containing protein [Winogradskyella sp.]
TLNSPLNGSIDVSVTTDLSWDAVSNATGYLLNVGSASGVSDILNGLDVGNVLTYDLSTDLPENSIIYVTIVPYNTDGSAIGCFEESFTTEDLIIPPNCTSLISPSDGLIGVNIDTGLMWNAVWNATGYLVTIATTSGGTDILNAFDVGNVVFYDLETILPEDTRIYVTITAYNADGLASGCTEQSFETQSIRDRIPRFFTPNNDGDNDFWIVPNEFNVVEEVLIFNRYGKILDKISNSTSQMRWDGTYNGAFLPSSDYWYSIQLKDGEVINGHFSLKR